MASTGQKWAIGCGIGCLLVIVVLGGVGTCGYVGVKRMIDRAEELEVNLDELEDRFGPLESFVPAADGAVSATTVQVFLTAREELLVRSQPLAEILATLDGGGGPIAKIRAGMEMVPAMLEFVGQRATVLLENGVHPGEYAYIYAIVYYSWLGYDPGDGPDFNISGGDENDGVRWQASESKHDVRRDRAHRTRRALNELMIAWLNNQHAELAAAGQTDTPWSETLAREVDALRLDPERLAWEDGLPEALEMSLAPYREDFAAGYSELLNGLEASLLDED